VVLDLPAVASKVLVDLAHRLDTVLVDLEPDADEPTGLVLGRGVRRGNLLVSEQDAAVRSSLLEDVALQALLDCLERGGRAGPGHRTQRRRCVTQDVGSASDVKERLRHAQRLGSGQRLDG
jgi:hypothetical protein